MVKDLTFMISLHPSNVLLWCISLFLFLVILLLLYFVRPYEIRKLSRRKELLSLRELDQQKSSFYKEMAREVLEPLTLIMAVANEMSNDQNIILFKRFVRYQETFTF
jgi:hypothetical protein